MKKYLLGILICISSATILNAQGNTTIAYTIGLPTGDLGDYATTSFRGVAIDYRHMINSNVAVGVHFNWTTFYEEKENDTYTSENVSLSGKQYRYSNNVPMAATVTYFSKPDEAINPYVSVGLGTMYTRRETNMNLYVLEQDAWNFLVQPEIGVQFATSESTAISLAVKYNHGFEAGSELSDPQTYVAFNVGFVSTLGN